MPRPPAPCGTYSAYKRHKRLGERVDAACEKAQHERVAEVKANRKSALTAERTLRIVPPPAPRATTSRLDMLREALDVVNTAIQVVATEDPTKLAPLIREKRELAREIDAIESDGANPVATLADQLAAATAARAARNAGA